VRSGSPYEGFVPERCDRCQRLAHECGMDTHGWVTILPPNVSPGLFCLECAETFGALGGHGDKAANA
jgi:hypothetical protein